jgi:hypothetical protein
MTYISSLSSNSWLFCQLQYFLSQIIIIKFIYQYENFVCVKRKPREKSTKSLVLSLLKGLSHEMDLDFDDM